MMTKLEKISSEMLTLPAEERAELAEILIQSIDEDEQDDIKASWLVEIRRRDQEIRSGKAICKPAAQVLREARDQLRCTE